MSAPTADHADPADPADPAASPPAQEPPKLWQPPPPPPEHPSADEIRRQVEYYFSDENLPTDRYLLEKCGGRENKPVSINLICSFQKMRPFKPVGQVVEALKKSAFLDVLPGRKIRRKIPFMGSTLLDDADAESDVEATPAAVRNVTRPALQQQLKHEKPAGWDKPHGFEPFYADPPITPAEHKEEMSIYDPATTFRLRMEIAIQRFKSRRTMHQHFQNVFAKFMKYGGVETSQRQFTGGVNDPSLENKDPADVALLMANHKIDINKDDEDMWPVDFEGVAKGFLSSFWPTFVFYDIPSIHLATTVLKNFYNYILYHNVCPEYADDINAARKVCDLADKELPMVIEAATTLPGDFNVACSTVFGGYHTDTWVEVGDWDDVEARGARGKFTGHTMEKARIMFKTGIAAYGTDEQFDQLEQNFDAIAFNAEADHVGMEVTKIEPPSAEVLEMYAERNAAMKGKLALTPLGKLHCKHWEIHDFVEHDLPAWRIKELKKKDAGRTYEFWVETDVLEHCFEGMKMQACVRTLNLGIQCLDRVQEVFCSFYTYLPNELIWSWKEPRFFEQDDDTEIAKVEGREEGELD